MFPGRTIAKVTFYGKSHLFNHVAEVLLSSCLKSKASQISMVNKTLKFSKIHSHRCTGFSTELSFTVHRGKVNWWPENIWFENKTRAGRSLLLSVLTHKMEHSVVTHTGVCHLQLWSTTLWLLHTFTAYLACSGGVKQESTFLRGSALSLSRCIRYLGHK